MLNPSSAVHRPKTIDSLPHESGVFRPQTRLINCRSTVSQEFSKQNHPRLSRCTTAARISQADLAETLGSFRLLEKNAHCTRVVGNVSVHLAVRGSTLRFWMPGPDSRHKWPELFRIQKRSATLKSRSRNIYLYFQNSKWKGLNRTFFEKYLTNDFSNIGKTEWATLLTGFLPSTIEPYPLTAQSASKLPRS